MAQTSKVKFSSNLQPSNLVFFKTKIWLEGVGLLAQKVLKNLQIALTDELVLIDLKINVCARRKLNTGARRGLIRKDYLQQ